MEKNLILLIFLCFINNINPYLVFPLKESENIIDDINQIDNFVYKYLNTFFSTELYIGDPQQDTTVYVYSQYNSFETQKEKIWEHYFSPSDSDTLQTLNKDSPLFLSSRPNYIAKDSIYFLENEGDISAIYTESGLIDSNLYKEYPNMTFLYVEKDDQSPPQYAIKGIDLSMGSLSNPEYDLFQTLKNSSIISPPVWSVQFKDEFYRKGYLVLGSYPHEYDSKNYKENQLAKVKAFPNTFGLWALDIINYLYFPSQDMKISLPYNTYVSFELEYDLIVAPKMLYFDLKEYYFDELFDSNKCNHKNPHQAFFFVYCRIDKFTEEDKKKFPEIHFYIKEINETLKLTYEDLFERFDELDADVLFMIFHEDVNHIKLGKRFLKKYQMVFDFQNNEIGVYRSQDNNRGEMLSSGGKTLVVVLIAVGMIIIGAVWYKCVYRKRKNGKLIDYNTANDKINHFSDDNINQGYELKNDDA